MDAAEACRRNFPRQEREDQQGCGGAVGEWRVKDSEAGEFLCRVEWSKTDRYGRTLGKVLVDGKDVNLSQVMAGLAWHYAAYAKDQSPTDRQAYADAESFARSKHIGLWASSRPTPPWDYRRGKTPVTAPSCSCDSHQVCTGPRGGRYCITSGGSKRYGG